MIYIISTLCTSHLNPPGHWRGKAGTITSYSPVCVSLGGGVNTRFHFFVAWFSDSSNSFGRASERTTSSRLKIRLTSSRMSGGLTFNLWVVACSRHLVIWTFDINYLRSSRSSFRNALQGLVRGFKRLSPPILYRGLWFVQLSTKGRGLHSVFLPCCLAELHWLSHSQWMSSPCPGGGVFKWLVHYLNRRCLCLC